MNGEVEVISGRPPAAARRAHYRLEFPAHWRARPVANPGAATLEAATIAWLATHGMGLNATEREKLRKFECGKYGGYSLPKAPLPEALLVTEFISLWLFWDDVEVEDHTQWDIDDVVRALERGAARDQGRYVAAWADLGRRLGETRSTAWRARLAASMRKWLENAKLETALARRLRDHGEWPDLDAAFDCRTVSIGMYPTFYLIEHADGFELPARFHEHPLVRSLKRTASRLVGMGNELGGVAKDIFHGWLNLVLVLGHAFELGVEAAFARVVDLHNREVQDFDRTANLLPSFGPELDEPIGRWIAAVRYSVYGFALWESRAERYQEYTALASGRALLATLDAGLEG